MIAPVLVQLDGGNNDIAWVDSNGGGCTVRLVALYPVYVDDPLLTIHLGDLSLPTLVLPSNNSNLVVFTNGQRSGLTNEARHVHFGLTLSFEAWDIRCAFPGALLRAQKT